MTDTIESDVTEIIITAGEPPTGRRWVWRSEPLVEDVVTFGTLPDPRDAYIAEQTARFLQLEQELGNANARIAELEAALRTIKLMANDQHVSSIYVVATTALMPEPEASMRETVEELEA